MCCTQLLPGSMLHWTPCYSPLTLALPCVSLLPLSLVAMVVSDGPILPLPPVVQGHTFILCYCKVKCSAGREGGGCGIGGKAGRQQLLSSGASAGHSMTSRVHATVPEAPACSCHAQPSRVCEWREPPHAVTLPAHRGQAVGWRLREGQYACRGDPLLLQRCWAPSSPACRLGHEISGAFQVADS
jgi:hypothetical protein